MNNLGGVDFGSSPIEGQGLAPKAKPVSQEELTAQESLQQLRETPRPDTLPRVTLLQAAREFVQNTAKKIQKMLSEIRKSLEEPTVEDLRQPTLEELSQSSVENLRQPMVEDLRPEILVRGGMKLVNPYDDQVVRKEQVERELEGSLSLTFEDEQTMVDAGELGEAAKEDELEVDEEFEVEEEDLEEPPEEPFERSGEPREPPGA